MSRRGRGGHSAHVPKVRRGGLRPRKPTRPHDHQNAGRLQELRAGSRKVDVYNIEVQNDVCFISELTVLSEMERMRIHVGADACRKAMR